jgi:hypothetical protein
MRYLACLRSHVLLFPYILDHSGSALPVVSIAETMLIITSAIRVSSPTSGPRFLLSFGVRSNSCVHRRNSRPAISLSIRSKPGEFGRFRQSPFSKDRPRFALQYHASRRAVVPHPAFRLYDIFSLTLGAINALLITAIGIHPTLLPRLPYPLISTVS